MKRTRFLALALVVAIMMMGAGYAYWSDTLTIGNTVATGELNVRFENTSLTDNDPDNIIKGVAALGDAKGKALGWKVTNLYPGAVLHFNTDIVNDGSIPAVIEEFIVVEGTELADLDRVDGDEFLVTGTITTPKYGAIDISILGDVTLANFNTKFKNYAKKMTLEPGQKIVVDLDVELDPDLEEDELENSYTSQVFTVNFTQHNDPAVQ